MLTGNVKNKPVSRAEEKLASSVASFSYDFRNKTVITIDGDDSKYVYYDASIDAYLIFENYSYFEEYSDWFDEGKFQRLRRITGYLVDTLDRWNDAKKAEEKARVKHCVNSAIDDAARLVELETQAMEHNIAYAQ